MRLIDADLTLVLLKSLGPRDYRRNKGTICEAMKMIASERYTPTIDAIPVNELLKLRDWLYESDGITMSGLRSLNELIAKYSSDPLPRIENGFERRNND